MAKKRTRQILSRHYMGVTKGHMGGVGPRQLRSKITTKQRRARRKNIAIARASRWSNSAKRRMTRNATRFSNRKSVWGRKVVKTRKRWNSITKRAKDSYIGKATHTTNRGWKRKKPWQSMSHTGQAWISNLF